MVETYKDSMIDQVCNNYGLNPRDEKNRNTAGVNIPAFRSSFRGAMGKAYSLSEVLPDVDIKDGVATTAVKAVGFGSNFIPVVGAVVGIAADVAELVTKKVEGRSAEQKAAGIERLVGNLRKVTNLSGDDIAKREWTDYSKDFSEITSKALSDELGKLSKEEARELGKKMAELALNKIEKGEIKSIYSLKDMLEATVEITGISRDKVEKIMAPKTTITKANALEFASKELKPSGKDVIHPSAIRLVLERQHGGAAAAA